jgi:hypothetical protein
LRADAVGAPARGELNGEVRDEQRGRQEADRREGDVVVVRERVSDGADVRDVPRQAAADREAGCDSACRRRQVTDSVSERPCFAEGLA